LFDWNKWDDFFLYFFSVEVSVMLQLNAIKIVNFFPWYSFWIDANLQKDYNVAFCG